MTGWAFLVYIVLCKLGYDIIDLGCGAGNYSKYFLNFEPHSLTLIDASENMLGKAKEKLQPSPSSTEISFKQTVLPDIPYDENSFDAALINLVRTFCNVNRT